MTQYLQRRSTVYKVVTLCGYNHPKQVYHFAFVGEENHSFLCCSAVRSQFSSESYNFENLHCKIIISYNDITFYSNVGHHLKILTTQPWIRIFLTAFSRVLSDTTWSPSAVSPECIRSVIWVSDIIKPTCVGKLLFKSEFVWVYI